MSSWLVRASAADKESITVLLEAKSALGNFLTIKEGKATISPIIDSSSLRYQIFNLSVGTDAIKYRVSEMANQPKYASLQNGKTYARHRELKLYVENPTDLLSKYDMGWVLTDEGEQVGIEARSFGRKYLNDAEESLVALKDDKSLWNVRLTTEGATFESKERPGKFLGFSAGHPAVTLSSELTSWKLMAPIHPLPYKPLLSLKLDTILGKTIKLKKLFKETSLNLLLERTDQKDPPEIYRFVARRAISGKDGYVSFQALLYPDYYIRHTRFGIRLEKISNDKEFQNEASWRIYYGFVNEENYLSVSIEPLGYPGLFMSFDSLMVKQVQTETEGEEASFVVVEVQNYNPNSPGAQRRKRWRAEEL